MAQVTLAGLDGGEKPPPLCMCCPVGPPAADGVQVGRVARISSFLSQSHIPYCVETTPPAVLYPLRRKILYILEHC
jgi:hypothetical protein